jgi:hypothetical protein
MAKADPQRALAADLEFQRRGWVIQRAGWVMMAAWLLASAAGATGPGPLSRGRVTTPDGRISIDYDRVLHRDASTRVVVRVEHAEAGALSLGLGGAYREAFRVHELVPSPRTQAAGPRARRFTLELDDAGRTRVELALVPLAWGWQTGELHLDGRPVATLEHLVLP